MCLGRSKPIVIINTQNSQWFDNECKYYKAAFRGSSAVYEKSPTDDNRRNMLHA